MTMQRDRVSELFGLAGTFPRPGWVVLDAARDHRFTGELFVETSPPVRVYLDRGVVYLAERLGDPSLGARLVDAGALSAAQLEGGTVDVGDVEHLGRLFERVPGVDRHTVMVTAELMTEECVRWLASQRVSDVVTTPYRHHESGVQQWYRPRVDLAPGDPLPAPRVDEPPVSVAPPEDVEPLDDLHGEPFLDGLIEWEEPAWFDRGRLEQELVEPTPDLSIARADAPTEPGHVPSRPDAEPEPEDWVDRLVADGLPERDPLTPPTSLPDVPVEPVSRFELVWPSGEVDEEFGTVDSVVGEGHDPDADRVGATARLSRPAPESPTIADEPALVDHGGRQHQGDDEPTDEIVLAVRRAVASIEVGSLAARQRLADSSPLRTGPRSFVEHADEVGVPEPGRVAVRAGRNDWSRRTVTRSVFDEPVVEPEAVEPEAAPEPDDHREQRAGALRRLISSLRR